MRPDIGTALTAIDAALGGRDCRQCRKPVDASPSPDFCSEHCQQTWYEQHTAAPSTTSGIALAESTPARPLGWLGPP
ncbi:MAG: DUF3631 domain-containing protein, partial [Pseudonocardiaceae bacterium]